jgi:hypothetical protein
MAAFLSPNEILHPTPRQLTIERNAAADNARWYKHRVGEAKAVAYWRIKWDMAKGLKEFEPFVFHYWLAYGEALGVAPKIEVKSL